MNKLRHLLFAIALLLSVALGAQTPDANGIVYVNKAVSGGTQSGNSWANAVPELADALLAAQTNTNITQIWVAKGTYYPMYTALDGATNPRYNAFVLVNNVKLYGGFDPNNGKSDLSTRDSLASNNGTILSGDIDNTPTGNSGNAYRVVISAGDVGTAELNGFTITGGNASGSSTFSLNGQDIYADLGGGMVIAGSSPGIANCAITNNSAFTGGGGIYFIFCNSPVTVTDCIISNNTVTGFGGYGGGISTFYDNLVTITNSVISGNSTLSYAGSIDNYGSALKIINCTITGNGSPAGNADIFNEVSSSLMVYNSIIYGNTDGTVGSDGSISAGPITVNNSDIQQNSGVYTGTGNINADPKFVSNYTLQSTSPAINTGNNNLYPSSAPATDLAGNPRTQKGTIDMGAYESAYGISPTNGIVYVNKNVAAGGDNSGKDWTNAVPELADALLAAQTNTNIKRIWVAKGTYYPLYPADGVSANANDNAFVTVSNVALYGGFYGTVGTEGDITKRDSLASNNGTILSGNINGNNTGNAYHVVVSAGVANDTLNGFTITGGNANGSGTTVVNNIQTSQSNGGGIDADNASPVITNCSINNNHANTDGGGIFLNYYYSEITNCIISNNTANTGGGGVYNTISQSTVVNTLFSGNTAPSLSGGAIFNYQSTITLINCTVSGNSDGIYNNNNGTVTINNSILWNTGSLAVYNLSGNVFANSSIIQGGGYGALNVNPLLSTTYTLQKNSPAISGGNYSLYPSSAPTIDLAGNLRSTSGQIDMGAYKYQPIIITPTNGIVYVNKSVSGGAQNGSSWTNAVKELADALAAAKTNSAIQKIWVAKGTYYPLYSPQDGTNFGTNQGRYNAFLLVNNVKVYGGFAGTETTINDRNFVTNETILSGDIDGNNAVDNGNAYHVVISAGAVGTAELNGFTVTGGNANLFSTLSTVNSQNIDNHYGGGIHIIASSPAINNCNIANNAANYGGGMYSTSSSPNMTNCAIVNNTVSANGGGIYNINSSSPTITNCSIANNNASTFGGGIDNAISSTSTINNSIIWDNNSGIYNETGGSATVQNSIVQNGYSGTNVLNQDPLFEDANTGDYSLQSGSPAINAGSNALYLSTYPNTDLAGNPRIVNSVIDMGAYENQITAAAMPVMLLNFTVNAQNNTALLQWTTATEINNKGFSIERSSDAQNWSSIGFVNSEAANGNSSAALSYSFTDNNPASGINYYRLKQEDFNGNADYSQIKSVDFGVKATITLYPNPARDRATVSGLVGNEEILIIDVAGRMLRTLKASGHSTELNLSGIAAGTYFIQVKTAGGLVTLKGIKE